MNPETSRLEDVKKLISERGAISAFKHFASG